MRIPRPASSFALPAVATLLAVAPGACSNPARSTAFDAAREDVTILGGVDAVAVVESGNDATALATSLRVALLSPLSFGIDVCVRPSGPGVNATFQGPLFYELPSLPDAGTDGKQAADAETDADVESRDGAGGLEAGAEGGVSDATSTDAAPRDAVTPDDAKIDGRSPDAGKLGDASALVDGGVRSGGVHYGQVSTYLTVAGAGTFDVAIVAGGSSSCSDPKATALVTLDAGKLYTLVVLSAPAPARGSGPSIDAGRDGGGTSDASATGERDAARSDAEAPDASAASLSLYVLTDEPLLSATLTRARFFNATTGGDGGVSGSLRVAAVENATTVPVASAVPVDEVSSANAQNPAVDTLGYWAGAPLAATTSASLLVSLAEEAGDAGGTKTAWSFASSSSFDLTAAERVHTGFVHGNTRTGLSLLWCDDTYELSVLNLSCADTASP